MKVSKESYTIDEDPMMHELHEIRNRMVEKEIDIDELAKKGEQLVKKYNLKPAVELPVAHRLSSVDR